MTIIVKTNTWIRDSHKLFDHSEQNQFKYYKQLFTVSDSIFFIRIYDISNIKVLKNIEELDEPYEPMFHIVKTLDHEWYINEINTRYINEINEINTRQKIWLLTSTSGYNLKEKDIIKLGNIKFKINKLVTESFVSTVYTNRSITADQEKYVCRICYEEDDQLMINPCCCKGTNKYVHLKCHYNWVGTIYNPLTNTRPSCHTCKSIYNNHIKIGSRTISCYDILMFPNLSYVMPEDIQVPYIELEKISDTNEKYILSVANKNILFGRSHKCHVIINDVTISKVHAMISYYNGKFILFDNNSKFGTMIYIKSPFKIDFNTLPINLQIGRTVFTINKNTDTLPS